MNNVDMKEYYMNKIKSNPPDINNYYVELGKIYESEKKYKEAIVECYVKIIKTDKYNGVILNQIGVCYSNLNEFKLAIHYFKKVIAIKEIDDVYSNIGICYTCLKDYKAAEENLLKSYSLNKKNDSVKHSLVELYYFLKDYNKSIDFFNKIDTNIKNYYIELYNVSYTFLANHNFKRGFELYENRLKITNVNNRPDGMHCRAEVPIDYWNGVDKCNSLLIIYEQGIGDNIMYYRFILMLSKVYPKMKITYFCKKEVKNIFKTFENINIVTEVTLINYDFKLYIMSLPYILKLESISRNNIDYINVNEAKVSYWSEKISHLKKFKVGFVYNGLLTSFIEKHIPIEAFKLLCEMDIDMICLHKKNEITNDLDKIDFKDKINVFDIDIDVPFEDTIALLKNIDLLITIDTFIVHLAGVLNVKTWLLLGNFSEWRWSNKKENYWYESVELVRHKDFKDIIKITKDKLLPLCS